MRAPFLSVYTASIPSHLRVRGVFPSLRNEEISSCSSEKAQKEKYCVWKLLEYALWHAFGKQIQELSFTKLENGKWECDFCYFSLSHSHNAVAVAVSDSPVGVDIERLTAVKNEKRIAEKILTEWETEEYRRLALSPENANEFLLEVWSKKESLFKTGDYPKFIPNRIETGEEKVQTRKICLDGERYFLSVANKDALQAKFFENSPYAP
ncbi:MAG: 4'-phosphopantetheinyl transferase superfamily protein [Clostridia bacterium]|nr:4'-phosphopantetheinyl transferase superfamily protein [Clostridia bacterium]